jgi:transcriptional regulator with GAF, ATPase, and Fis domain
MDTYEFNRQLAEAAREMAQQPDTQATLDRAIEMVTELVPACDVAGISLAHPDGIDTPAASGEALREIDEYQYEIGEGPCLEALRRTDVVTSSNLAIDERWPRWGPRIAGELGIHSSMSFRLFTTERSMGALNLYAEKDNAFDHADLLEGTVLAAHVAIALAASIEEEQLHSALDSRRMIGEATGILRERFGLTTDQAFRVLRRVSSQQNIKLHRVAQELVETGSLPNNGSRHGQA